MRSLNSLTFSFLTTLVALSLVSALSGCKAGHDDLADFCTELSELSKEPGECSAFAKQLQSLTDDNQELLQSLSTLDPPEDEREQWKAAMAGCYASYIAIATGPCGEFAEVEDAVEAFGR